MNAQGIKNAYRRYAAVYDHLFGRVFEPGRRRAIDLVNAAPGRRVLEVGVGTGLTLPHYHPDLQVTGIDFSRDMLDRARTRVAEASLHQIENLLEMDAQQMTFADDSFDAVVAMYVVSVVPDPERLLAEMRRVCVPGGDIVIVNHFASQNVVMRTLERSLAPLSSLMGFRPDLDLGAFQQAANLHTVDMARVNAMGFWRLIRFRNVPANDWASPDLVNLELASVP